MGWVFRHGQPASALSATCSETGSQQTSRLITAHRPNNGRCALAKAPHNVRSRLYTSTSWLSWRLGYSIIVISLLSCLCAITRSEHISTSSLNQPKIDQKSTKLTGCEELTMGHTESPEYHHLQTLLATTESLWVFGYGSLVWKTGFDYKSQKTGYINGFVRRFWQGDTTHRGTMSAPGRVATLEKDESGLVWGVAFELEGREQIETALEHLGMRECHLGGYDMHLVPFYSHDHSKDNNNNNNNNNNDNNIINREPLDTLVFLASPGNRNYLGRATIEDLTDQIISSKGNAGHNVEYVTRLAEFMRDTLPSWMADNHLEELDSSLRKTLLQRNIDLEALLALEASGYSYMYQKEDNEHAQEEVIDESVEHVGGNLKTMDRKQAQENSVDGLHQENGDQHANTLTTETQSTGNLVKSELKLTPGVHLDSNSKDLLLEQQRQSRKRKLSSQESTEAAKSRPKDHTSEL